MPFWWRSTAFWLFQFSSLKKENAYLQNLEHLIPFDMSRFRQPSPEFKTGDGQSSFCLPGISIPAFSDLEILLCWYSCQLLKLCNLWWKKQFFWRAAGSGKFLIHQKFEVYSNSDWHGIKTKYIQSFGKL